MFLMKNLEEHINLINLSKTPEEAFGRYSSIMKQHGYDRVSYSLVTDHPSLELPRQHGLATSYPEDWMKFYNEKNYMSIDPVTQRCLSSRKPFFWSEVTEDPKTAASSLQLMNEAEDAGVTDGIGISLCGQAGELVGIGLARSSNFDQNKEKDYSFFAAAYLLSVYFHETFRDILSKPQKVTLTQREIEILCWASEGKTDEEIAKLLSLSLNTVRYHWKKIFYNLQANGRIYAITKAIRLQLITPAFVRNPYRNW
jgi:DNA-binding CsgD family transcriptional regulator